MSPPKSKCRQKIQMKRMTKERNLMVTFSKRRSGLFKKTSELCTLCAVEIAIIVFSPGKKVFSFGHPCVEAIVNRFLAQNPASSLSGTSQLVEAHRNANVRDLNVQLTHLLNELENEKKRNEELCKARKMGQASCWWESPIENLGLQELEQLKVAMEELKKSIAKQAERQMVVVQPQPLPIFPVAGPRVVGGGSDMDVNGSGLGLSMTPHGFVLGYGHRSF